MLTTTSPPPPAGPFEPPGVIEASLATMSQTRLRRTLYVGGLEESVTTEVLHAAFIPFGDIRTVEIPTQKESNKHRGFGFVEMDSEEDAQHAIDNMHEAELYGRVVTVNIARTPAKGPGENAKPVWADDFFYRKKLAEEGLDVDEQQLEKAPQESELNTHEQ
eukprot:GHVN01101915.1.p1 GENE.GHVN01101915.1~~GHVN01101915.1.p1  ORF type:complete len:162 (+),score=22.58 GHVN01101915.1:102-587(+)